MPNVRIRAFLENCAASCISLTASASGRSLRAALPRRRWNTSRVTSALRQRQKRQVEVSMPSCGQWSSSRRTWSACYPEARSRAGPLPFSTICARSRQPPAVEGTLLLLNLKSDQPAQPAAAEGGEPPITVAHGRAGCGPFQIGLLATSAANARYRISNSRQVAEKWNRSQPTQPVFQLCGWVGVYWRRCGRRHPQRTAEAVAGQRPADQGAVRGRERAIASPPIDLLNTC